MRYFIHTYGCQMNHSDTERLTAVLENLGYQPSEKEEKADLLFYNTCSIRQKAEDRVYGRMQTLQEIRQHRPRLMVGITGCMVRTSSTKQSKKRDKLVNYPAVDIALRIEDLAKLGQLIREVRPEIKISKNVDDGTLGNYFKIAPKRVSNRQVWIPIQTGCDKYCTFCIVPFSRGRERSRTTDEILEECQQAVENGAVEITLIGQTVDSYGLSVADKMSGQFQIKDEIPNVVFNARIFENQKRDLKSPERTRLDPAKRWGLVDTERSSERYNLMAYSPEAQKREKAERPFVTLLRKIDELKTKGLRRLRFTSPHPQDFSEDLIRLHNELETLQPAIHLPVQSGSNQILKAMRRTYTREHYLELIQLIRRHIPDCTISTDVIVGFPGETEEDFMQSYALLQEVEFDMAFMAQYSPRKGTYAAKHLPNDVSRKEKAERFHRLNALLTQTVRKNHARFLGSEVEVLVEKQKGRRCSGRTPHFKEVFFDSGRNLIGEFANVKITGARDWFLEGELVGIEV